MVKKQVGGGNTFRLVSAGAVAQIKDSLLRALFLQIADLAGDLLRLARRECVDLDVAHTSASILSATGGIVTMSRLGGDALLQPRDKYEDRVTKVNTLC